MDGIMEVLKYAAMGYFGLAIVKTIMMWERAWLAAQVMTRLNNHKHEPGIYFVALVVTIPFIATMNVVPALLNEKWRYFVVYTSRQVMRELIRAHRRP